MSTRHIADSESQFLVMNVTPDFCRVFNSVVPFEIYQFLPSEKVDYAATVHARGQKTLKVGSVVAAVQGDLGQGVFSGVSMDDGHSVMGEGASGVRVEGRPVARHGDLCYMNSKV